MFPWGKIICSHPSLPLLRNVDKSQLGHIRMADQQRGRGLGAWTTLWSRVTVPVLDCLPLGGHRREK